MQPLALSRRAELSEHFTDLQNEIAQQFKVMILSLWNISDDADDFVQNVSDLYAQHKSDAYVDGRLTEVDYLQKFRSTQWFKHNEPDLHDLRGSLYHACMEMAVYCYAVYNDLDIEFDGNLDLYGFDYATYSAALTAYADKAIKQFAGGRNAVPNMLKQLAIISIVQQYKQSHMKITLRQLYYQMVSKNYIANNEREYKNICSITGAMREACVLELDEFADNTRFAFRYSYAEDVESWVKSQIVETKYNLDSRKGQGTHLEVWIEKEALRTVFKPITDQYDIPLFVCRGYPSTSSLFQQAEVIMRKVKHAESVENVVILYYGDHDPSGLQIPEAILNIFHKDYQMKYVEIDRRGLLKRHIKYFNLPPNPAKLTDPRADGYIREHGTQSWELDAVDPQELQRIIRADIMGYTNEELVDNISDRQLADRSMIINIRQNMGDIISKFTKDLEDND